MWINSLITLPLDHCCTLLCIFKFCLREIIPYLTISFWLHPEWYPLVSPRMISHGYYKRVHKCVLVVTFICLKIKQNTCKARQQVTSEGKKVLIRSSVKIINIQLIVLSKSQRFANNEPQNYPNYISNITLYI